MTDNFHSKDCATRHGSNECDCGYVRPLTKDERRIGVLRTQIMKEIEWLESYATACDIILQPMIANHLRERAAELRSYP